MIFFARVDILPLDLVYFILANGNFVLENNISFAVGILVPFDDG